jgi:cell volume regulation protein A
MSVAPELALVVGALVLIAAVAAVRLSTRTGLPSLLLYLGLGIVLGEDVLGIPFDDEQLAQSVGYTALALILAEGGLTTRWASIRGSLGPASALATLGTCVSFLVTGAGAWLLLDLDLLTSMLLGAVVASTDSAAVFSVLRSVRLPRRVVGILEAESGFNDAPAVLAVIALTASATGRQGEPWWLAVLLAAAALGIGLVVGVAVGWLGAVVLARLATPVSGPFPLAVIAAVGIAYGAAHLLHGSGFLAVYVAALVLGNRRLPHGGATRGFATSLGWLAQIGLFVLLGLLVTPSRLPAVVLPALAVTAVLVLLARPLSVLSSLVWFRVPWRDQLFLSWAGLRGAVPIVLATIPVVEGRPVRCASSTSCSWSSWCRCCCRPRRCRSWRAGSVWRSGPTASPSRSRAPRWGGWGPTCSRSTSTTARGCTGSTCSSCACPSPRTCRSSSARRAPSCRPRRRRCATATRSSSSPPLRSASRWTAGSGR